MEKLICVTTAFSSKEEGLKMARGLVEKKIVACAQLVDTCTSVYRWKGEVMEEQEYVLLMKTVLSRYEALEKYVKAHHPYELPELVVTELIHAEALYGRWVQDEVTT